MCVCVAYLHKAQSPYSVNMLAIMAAQAAVEDPGYVETYVAEVLAARELLCLGLEKLGVSYVPSSANFVLARFGGRAIEVRDALRDRAILVRDRSYEAPGCVRITVGTREQTRRMLDALEEIWNKPETSAGDEQQALSMTNRRQARPSSNDEQAQ